MKPQLLVVAFLPTLVHAATLGIRNTSLTGPLASTYVVISEGDRSGGGGANFIVEGEASRPVPPPLMETAMISTASTQGLSLTSSACMVEEW